MFIGHALLAFALAVLIAEWRGWDTRQAFALGIATGAFAALPDVDVLYAAVAADPTKFVAGAAVRPEAFWGPANEAHRLMTHSLVVAALAGPAFGLWTLRSERGWRRGAAALAAVVLAALVAVAGLTSGLVGAFVVGAFVLVGVVLAEAARSRLALSPRIVALAATAGIASHPWGDLVTGEPPALFYPLNVSLLSERILLSSDPTLHLLGAFGLELGVVALAVGVVARQLEYEPHRLIDRRALLGVAYGVAAVVMTPPTIHLSYRFVGSILAVGGVCGVAHPSVRGWYPLRTVLDRLVGTTERALRTVLTTLTGIAIALVSYGAVYLAIS
ncbi:hydrolase [Halovenus sp. WSH3]|uniref:Hydrolase n=1 Tax=Halovenus carboxidivorans TaxID=2692199 RepID=A0A6B0SXI9_9EURY|nr:hydrolase [Halovenus carboxidivorans]